MGAWSTSITGNDLANDLLSEYTAAFSHYDVQTALEKIEGYVRREEGCSEADPGEWCDFFYSLANFMWKKGILTEEVKQHAVEMIDSGFGLELWEEAGASMLAARKKALAKFRAQLLSPMPEKKKIKPNVYLTDIFETGDLIAIQLQTAGKRYLGSNKKLSDEAFQALDGKYILLQKIRCHVSWTSRIAPEVKDHWAVFRLIDGVYDKVPTDVNISSLKDASISVETWNNSFSTPLFMCQSSLFYFKRRKYQLIGNYPEAAVPYLKLRDADIYFGIDSERTNTDSQFIDAIKNLKVR